MQAQINALEPGNSTNLHGGWLHGANQVADSLTAEGIHRVLLLSDGLANRGVTDRLQIVGQTREMCRRCSISTSTFGVGEQYDETLMREMAEQGGGHYYFIETPAQIPGILQRELGEMLTVIARQAWLNVAFPAGMEANLRGDLPYEQEANRIRFFLGDLFSGEERYFYFRVVTPPGPAGSSLTFPVEVSFEGSEGKSYRERAEVQFSYEEERAFRGVVSNQDVLRRYALVSLAATTTRAIALEREGKQRESAALLESELEYRRKDLDKESLQQYADLARRLREGLTTRDRKQADYEQYQRRQSRI
jgi:Ca-activated chloride channel family protein